MREKLIDYVNLLFAGTDGTEEIRQEILQNTLDRYDDLIGQGKAAQEAMAEVGAVVEGYYAAKRGLFADLPLKKKAMVINADDEYGRRMLEEFPPALGVGMRWPLIGRPFLLADVRRADTSGLDIMFHWQKNREERISWPLRSPLVGLHNASNLLTAHSDMASVVDSLVAPLSVINALIVALSLRTMDSTRAKLEQLEQLWNSYEVYQSVDGTESKV